MLVLLLSAWLGLANYRDILHTTTLAQRMVGVTACAYGLTALVAVYALLRGRKWLARLLLLWAALVVTTAVLATIVYDNQLRANIVVLVVSTLLVSPVVWYGKARSR
jgi:hypothetical protein